MKTMNLTFVCLLVSLLMGAGSVKAQDSGRDYSEERLRVRAEWMALNMAERYGLDENQVKELTEANVTWLKQRGETEPFQRFDGRRDYRRHHRQGHRAYRHGGCCGAPRHADYCCEAYCADGHHAPDCPYVDGRRAPLSKEEIEKFEAERKKAVEERRAARDAYEQSLQKIMTEEQYKAYTERRR